MKILVIGASKGTGALAVKAALARGHEVTAFSRSPQKIGITHDRLRFVAGSFHDAAAIEAVVPGHNAVLVTPGVDRLSVFKETPDYFSRGTAFVVAAMQRSHVKRLVILSALGSGDSRPLLAFPLRILLTSLILKPAYVDHDVQERLARQSGLEWVVARPSRLTDAPARGAYVKTKALVKVPGSITRADVADFMLDAAEHDEWIGSNVQLGG